MGIKDRFAIEGIQDSASRRDCFLGMGGVDAEESGWSEDHATWDDTIVEPRAVGA